MNKRKENKMIRRPGRFRIPKTFRGWRRVCSGVFRQIRKSLKKDHPAIPMILDLEKLSLEFGYEGWLVGALYNGYRDWEDAFAPIKDKELEEVEWENTGADFLFQSCEAMLANTNILDKETSELLESAISDRRYI